MSKRNFACRRLGHAWYALVSWQQQPNSPADTDDSKRPGYLAIHLTGFLHLSRRLFDENGSN